MYHPGSNYTKSGWQGALSSVSDLLGDLQLHPKYTWAGQAILSSDQIKIHCTLWSCMVCRTHEVPLQNYSFLANYKIEKLQKELHPLDNTSGSGTRVKFSDLNLPLATSMPGILWTCSPSPISHSNLKSMGSLSSVTFPNVGKVPQVITPMFVQSHNPFAVIGIHWRIKWQWFSGNFSTITWKPLWFCFQCHHYSGYHALLVSCCCCS